MGKRNKTGLKIVLNSPLICLFFPNSGYEMYVLQLSDMLFCKSWASSEKSCVNGIGYLHSSAVRKEAAEQYNYIG